MRIEIGDKYLVTADQYNYILQERKVAKEGKNVGSEYLQTVGYFTRISQLVTTLIQLEVRQSDIASLSEMDAIIKAVGNQCEAAFKAEMVEV